MSFVAKFPGDRLINLQTWVFKGLPPKRVSPLDVVVTQVFDDLIFQFLRRGAIVEVLGRLVVATRAVKEAPDT